MTPRFLIAVFSLAMTSAVSLDAAALEQAMPSEREVQAVKPVKPFENAFRRDALRADGFKATRNDSFLANKSKSKGHDVPELSGSAAGAGLALALGGLLALTGRRKRRETA